MKEFDLGTQAKKALEGRPFITPTGRRLVVRHCHGFGELDACIELQAQTWGYSELETMPRRNLVLAQELGGHVIGAFDLEGIAAAGETASTAAPRLVGFAMALPALGRTTGSQPYLHSHMLAVRPGYRDSGLGLRLKLAQREDALARGITRMTWTFDPLAAKNAYFNLERLGAIATRYSPDFYGASNSQLQGGLPTDRLHAKWLLASARVCDRVGQALTGTRPVTVPAPGVISPDNPLCETIVLPREVAKWKNHEGTFPRALALQGANRERFLDAFARGLALTGFRKGAEGNGVFVLTPQHDLESKDNL